MDNGQNKDENTANMLALSAEVLLVVLPVSHAGFTVDFPLVGSGKQSQGGQSRDRDTMKVTTLGLQFGALMWF